MYTYLQNNQLLKGWAEEVEAHIHEKFKEIDQRVELHQMRALKAFREEGVSEHHLAPSTGYGYDDAGRERLERIFARLFGAEEALVRSHIVSGTHAISASLFAVLRPGDQLLSITGPPYDTLKGVIGNEQDGSGSLADFGIGYREIALTASGEVDVVAVREAVRQEKPQCVAIQRSRGYAARPSFTIAQIKEMINVVRTASPQTVIFVDNCYGEFVEEEEPTHVGADLIAGSLIKNPGGGMAKSGGYIAGRAHWVKRAATAVVAPGIGSEGGATYGYLRDYFQGLFLAPHVVGQALKSAVFSAAMLERAGFPTSPRWNEGRTDIIQQISFQDRDLLIAFCEGIQEASPIDAHLLPVPAPMPGYPDDVIMAAGTFVQGASIELSADGPLRPPYTGFLQGGLTYAHGKAGILIALDRMLTTGKMKKG
ncbi:methionine gamma-lyase family protein [Mechercharimyces sp. CAU 1602]|uniref:methionine gamma-lyase family protein n=1 Tax=Mechercharimyces sp. CAU 1602 TaxID=2973933 RepID=UPI0021627CF2|nr:methionine gamma-lyase family protein [Mechercharimyces sp. CAU 1602]MCS1351203.1 methionine gamma-lyase family protein [Mechercharimyces sp. CAU 1602]